EKQKHEPQTHSHEGGNKLDFTFYNKHAKQLSTKAYLTYFEFAKTRCMLAVTALNIDANCPVQTWATDFFTGLRATFSTCNFLKFTANELRQLGFIDYKGCLLVPIW